MALTCFLGRVPTSVLKGQFLSSLNKKLSIRSGCANFHQPYHFQKCESSVEFPIFKHSRKSCSPLLVAHRFSTSPSLFAQHKSHDHTKIWTFERFLAGVLLPLAPAALIYPSQPLDTALALIIVLHTHFGLEAIVVDYIRPIIFGNVIPKISLGVLYLFSIVTLAGLLNLIYNDEGLANAIINIWKK